MCLPSEVIFKKILCWYMQMCPPYRGVRLTIVRLIEVFLWETHLRSAGKCESVYLREVSVLLDVCLKRFHCTLYLCTHRQKIWSYLITWFRNLGLTESLITWWTDPNEHLQTLFAKGLSLDSLGRLDIFLLYFHGLRISFG